MELSPEPSAPPLPPRNRRGSVSHQFGRNLRRGTLAFGRAVGDFFGVTEASQQGNDESMGWGQVAQIRAEETTTNFSTLRRATRFALGSEHTPPPSYPDIEMAQLGPAHAAAQLQSFDPNELSSDESDDDDAFYTDDLPPSYSSLPTGGRITSMYGHEDPTRVPNRPNLQPITEERSDVSQVSSQVSPQVSQTVQDGQYFTNKERALQYYMDYVKAEQRIRQRQNRQNASEFFGEGSSAPDRPARPRGRVSSVGEAVIMKTRKNRSKLQRQNTQVREKVQSLPTFWPIFIIGITFVQVVVVIVLISIHKPAPIHIKPVERSEQFPSLRNESGNETVIYYRYTNPWFGIGVLNLIQSGVKFTPCMRHDQAITSRNLIQRAREKENGGLGCCQNNIWVGSTIPTDCVDRYAPSNSSEYLDNFPCEDTTLLLANFHPCCIGIIGQCKVTHVRECRERGGVYHPELDSCNETNCLNDVCGFNGVGMANNDPLQPSGGQSWRLVLSLFIHLGVIDVVIIGVIQLYLGIKIERTAGFLRIALIYFIAGIGGNLVSAIFIPYQVTGGASAAVFGLASVLFVELFQVWQIIDKAWLELIKLVTVMVILLAIGTLPFIDNLANIGGIIFGVPAAIIFLPYITFGKVDAWRKRILLIICVPLLLIMFLVCFLLFFFIGDPDFCSVCHYFNCVPFTSTFCNNEINSPNPEVVAL